MSTYLGLPPLQIVATADTTGRNSGNWTHLFDSAALGGLRVPYFELYHATVTKGPAGASATLQNAAGYIWGFTAPGTGAGSEYHLGGSGWLLTTSQEFYVFWNAAASGVAPVFTAWFRYDLDIPANRAASGAGQ